MYTRESKPMGVRVTSRIKEWGQKSEREQQVALLELATTIHRDAGNLAPRDTGNLISSGRIEPISGESGYRVIFGGGSIKYAKRRHYENRKNPGTLLYLQRAGNKNSKNFSRYMRGKS